jgi:hypothetical protein
MSVAPRAGPEHGTDALAQIAVRGFVPDVGYGNATAPGTRTTEENTSP